MRASLYSISESPAPLMDINTTPLIDVMLVLLIMVIITMPLATHAVKIDLPHNTIAAPTRPTMNVYIDFDGALYWNDTAVKGLGELQQYLVWVSRQEEQPNVVVTANRFVKYDYVAQVLAAAQRNGVRYLGFAGNQAFVD